LNTLVSSSFVFIPHNLSLPRNARPFLGFGFTVSPLELRTT
jgi:hypothetical protein